MGTDSRGDDEQQRAGGTDETRTRLYAWQLNESQNHRAIQQLEDEQQQQHILRPIENVIGWVVVVVSQDVCLVVELGIRAGGETRTRSMRCLPYDKLIRRRNRMQNRLIGSTFFRGGRRTRIYFQEQLMIRGLFVVDRRYQRHSQQQKKKRRISLGRIRPVKKFLRDEGLGRLCSVY